MLERQVYASATGFAADTTVDFVRVAFTLPTLFCADIISELVDDAYALCVMWYVF